MSDEQMPVTAGRAVRADRRRPSVLLAGGVAVVYAAIFTGTQLASGIGYQEMFDSASNAWHGPVLGLTLGAVFLLAVHALTRWDHLWRDASRLRMRWPMWCALGAFVAAVVVRFAGASWSAVDGSLLAAILVAGALVGLTEELLFRGFVLRALREKASGEGVAVLVTTLAFGAMHLMNILQGNTLGQGLGQLVLASLTGLTLYLFRRSTGLLVAAMAAHALWDVSTFLPSGAPVLNLVMALLAAVGGLLALVSVVRHGRTPALPRPGDRPSARTATVAR
jgi:membrane protease YdiL (CAAX protease family)